MAALASTKAQSTSLCWRPLQLRPAHRLSPHRGRVGSAVGRHASGSQCCAAGDPPGVVARWAGRLGYAGKSSAPLPRIRRRVLNVKQRAPVRRPQPLVFCPTVSAKVISVPAAWVEAARRECAQARWAMATGCLSEWQGFADFPTSTFCVVFMRRLRVSPAAFGRLYSFAH